MAADREHYNHIHTENPRRPSLDLFARNRPAHLRSILILRHLAARDLPAARPGRRLADAGPLVTSGDQPGRATEAAALWKRVWR
jgi:hypothetical protein